MWRLAYTLVLIVMLPLILLRLWWRGKSNPAYRARIKERLGDYGLNTADKRIWVHAVSVGEVNAAVPLIKRIQQLWPDYRILITTMTPTGAAQVKKQFADSLTHRYVPYDIPLLINRALDQANPQALVIMETEIWPNWIHAAHKRNIPVIYISLRLADKSFSGYLKIRSLLAPALHRVKTIAAQTDRDAQRIIELGARPEAVQVVGNLKYDATLPVHVQKKGAGLRHQLGESRLIWIAASTHTSEDEQVLAAHQIVLEHLPNALLIIVPRHPERFDRVYELCRRRFITARRTAGTENAAQAQVYLGDTMGELLEFYAASDICFVGGSLVEHGGQNVLEPWLIGRPVLVGPHMFNFARITEQALNHKAMLQIESATQLGEKIVELAASRTDRERLVANATELLEQNKGALESSLELIKQYL